MESILNLAVSWALFALIWVVQLVHYPSFRYIAEEAFLSFHNHHTASITYIVMPLMLLELALSAFLAWKYQFCWDYTLVLLMVAALWAITFFIAVPLHHKLREGKDLQIIDQLVQTNWPRTLLWTLKALLVSWIVLKS